MDVVWKWRTFLINFCTCELKTLYLGRWIIDWGMLMRGICMHVWLVFVKENRFDELKFRKKTEKSFMWGEINWFEIFCSILSFPQFFCNFQVFPKLQAKQQKFCKYYFKILFWIFIKISIKFTSTYLIISKTQNIIQTHDSHVIKS